MKVSPILLLPAPRNLQYLDGFYSLASSRLIVLQAERPQELFSTARRFQQVLRERLSLDWKIVAGASNGKLAPEKTGLLLRVSPQDGIRPQGYECDINQDGLCVQAADAAGLFYGICTLIQVIQRCGVKAPCLHISDWPDFPARGVMLDISRDKVPTMDTLYELVDMLASWKINQVQLYTEHTFAYQQHQDVWAMATPLSGQDILELDAYCAERFIELVPNQNSFGHMERWLSHAKYQHLSEVDKGFTTPWGHVEGRYSLCPGDPRSLELVSGLYDELLPHFRSRMVNVGCDETFDLGQGRSKDDCEKRGVGRVYLDFLMKIYENVKGRGYTMQYWGDIILNHPELIPELPKDAIALEWGYEANYPFNANSAKFAASGIPFYVCPGTSSWNSLAGRSDNALANLLSAAENGLKHGACGYLNTDWGDGGHWQMLPVSYLGFAAGAAYSWALEANRGMNMAQAASIYAFRDPTGILGQAAFELGNFYHAAGFEPINGSALFFVLQWPVERLRSQPALHTVDFNQLLARLDGIMNSLPLDRLEKPNPTLIKELEITASMLRHACLRGMLAAERDPEAIQRLKARLDLDLRSLMCDYEQAWLKRNRSGGLVDSLTRFEKARKDYA